MVLVLYELADESTSVGHIHNNTIPDGSRSTARNLTETGDQHRIRQLTPHHALNAPQLSWSQGKFREDD
jgi:hypothetical protein